MRKIKKIVVAASSQLSALQMQMITGGDTDPNVCHSKTTDSTCSGECYQYVGGPEGFCYWNYVSHSCGCTTNQ